MVVLTDPNDNTPKVFARTQYTDESRLSSAGRLLGSGMGAGNGDAETAFLRLVRGGVSTPTVGSALICFAFAAHLNKPRIASRKLRA